MTTLPPSSGSNLRQKRLLWIFSDRWACGTLRTYVPSLSLIGSGHWTPYFLQMGEDVDRDGLKLANLDGIDLLVIQRATHPRFLEWVKAAKVRHIPVVLELDDDLWHIPKHNPVFAEWGSKTARRVYQGLVEGSTHIMVSTPPLKESLVHACDVDPAKVTVGYNHVHPNLWNEDALANIVPQNNGSDIILGYQGSATHSADFGILIDPLTKILSQFPQVKVRFFGNIPLSIKGKIPVSRFEWMKGVVFEQYPRNLRFANFDIGLAPLVDNRFNRAKSGIKAMDYGCVKVPCVASNLPPYQPIITHGENGFLCSTQDEWYEALTTLILDYDRRAAMGQALHQTVWSKWDWQTHGPTWVTLFDRLTERT